MRRSGQGNEGTLEATEPDRKIQILSDPQAVLAAAKKAGRRGKARTRDLVKVEYAKAKLGPT